MPPLPALFALASGYSSRNSRPSDRTVLLDESIEELVLFLRPGLLVVGLCLFLGLLLVVFVVFLSGQSPHLSVKYG